MKILFIGLACHFTRGMTYQDNMLFKMCSENPENQVYYISDVYEFQNGKLVKREERVVEEGNSAHIYYVEYDRIINDFVSSKIQKVSKVKSLIEHIEPDVIFFHNIGGKELFTVRDYVRKNPHVVWYADSHADFHNTAKTRLAKFLYKVVQGYFIKRSYKEIDKIFYITPESKEYLKEMYHIPEEQLEWYPLGGIVFSEEEYQLKRDRIRKKLGLSDDMIFFLHTGKMSKEKRTKELLDAFTKVKDDRFALALIGNFTEEVSEQVMPMIEQDRRIKYLGWKKGEELFDYLCAADVYVQPGTQSATLQNAICCKCSALVYPYPSHKVLIEKNGLYVRDTYEIQEALEQISNNPAMVHEMSKESEKLGKEVLDYKKLTERICRDKI